MAAVIIVGYLLATLLLGALLAPIFYWAGQNAATVAWLHFLGGNQFTRFFDRAVLVSAFLLFPWALYLVGVRHVRSVDFLRDRHWAPRFLAGLVLATGFLWCLGVAAAVPSGLYGWKHPIPWQSLVKVGQTALAVSLLEETLFRGVMLRLFQRTMRPGRATILVSGLFAVVHFLRPPRAQLAVVHWHSGLALIPTVFRSFADPLLVLGGFATLFVLGLMLGSAAIRTGSIWLPVGLHAGVIFGKMGFNKLAKRYGEWPPWFGADLTIGLGPLLILLFLWLVVWLLFLRANTSTHRAGPSSD